MAKTFFIFYVRDQNRSTDFYRQVFACEPSLHVPGMTEFELEGGGSLGLMPEQGIRSLLGEVLPDPAAASGVPRAELYLSVGDSEAFHKRALEAGAKELSPLRERPWGDLASYVLDPDGHVLAFAE
ncbi:VOC family protein [bacterium]|nr:VOC family protein [bacterium]